MTQHSEIIMGMPVTIRIDDAVIPAGIFEAAFDYLRWVDEVFSTYKPDSQISRLNRGELSLTECYDAVQEIFTLAEETKQRTNGYFDIHRPDGSIDPSGIVKGWAIHNTATLLRSHGVTNFFVDVAGDIQPQGTTADYQPWAIGIRNPFNRDENVKVLSVYNEGIATSGTAVRGQHIYNPKAPRQSIDDVVSLTVIGPNVYEADRFATAAFAMGAKGVEFIERLPGFEAYQINAQGIATMTSGFDHYVASIS